MTSLLTQLLTLAAHKPAATLTVRSVCLLLLIARWPGVGIGEASQQLNAPKPSMTRAATSLSGAGLIVRLVHKGDKRLRHMHLTELGRTLLASLGAQVSRAA